MKFEKGYLYFVFPGEAFDFPDVTLNLEAVDGHTLRMPVRTLQAAGAAVALVANYYPVSLEVIDGVYVATVNPSPLRLPLIGQAGGFSSN